MSTSQAKGQVIRKHPGIHCCAGKESTNHTCALLLISVSVAIVLIILRWLELVPEVKRRDLSIVIPRLGHVGWLIALAYTAGSLMEDGLSLCRNEPLKHKPAARAYIRFIADLLFVRSRFPFIILCMICSFSTVSSHRYCPATASFPQWHFSQCQESSISSPFWHFVLLYLPTDLLLVGLSYRVSVPFHSFCSLYCQLSNKYT